MSHSHHESGHHTKADFERELVAHDEWFRHSAEEPHHQISHGETNASKIGVFLFVVIVATFGTAWVLVKGLLRVLDYKEIARQERNEPFVQEYRESRARWDGALTASPEWADSRAGTVRIPVDLAMQLVIEEYKGKAAN